MDYYHHIKAFQPSCDQEESDQKVILAYIEQFDNILTRENTFAHLSSSGFIINESCTKTLMIYHNIYRNWGWTGGHTDGESDLPLVAIKEAKEETGLKQVRLLSQEIASLDILPVPGHYKHGKYLSAHMHLSVAYVLVADETDAIQMNQAENSGVQWIPIDEIEEQCKETIMHPVYRKLVAFARRKQD